MRLGWLEMHLAIRVVKQLTSVYPRLLLAPLLGITLYTDPFEIVILPQRIRQFFVRLEQLRE